MCWELIYPVTVWWDTSEIYFCLDGNFPADFMKELVLLMIFAEHGVSATNIKFDIKYSIFTFAIGIQKIAFNLFALVARNVIEGCRCQSCTIKMLDICDYLTDCLIGLTMIVQDTSMLFLFGLITAVLTSSLYIPIVCKAQTQPKAVWIALMKKGILYYGSIVISMIFNALGHFGEDSYSRESNPLLFLLFFISLGLAYLFLLNCYRLYKTFTKLGKSSGWKRSRDRSHTVFYSISIICYGSLLSFLWSGLGWILLVTSITYFTLTLLQHVVFPCCCDGIYAFTSSDDKMMYAITGKRERASGLFCQNAIVYGDEPDDVTPNEILRRMEPQQDVNLQTEQDRLPTNRYQEN